MIGHAPHILIIDDDTQLRTMLAELLSLEQYRVSTASRGIEGLDKAQKTEFDLLVLDVMMPGLDGFEVLKRLRLSKSTPVIMLTARGEETDRIEGLEYGADDYLAKPFNPRELLLRIRAILRRLQQPELSTQCYRLGNIELDEGAQSAMLNNEPLSLTAAEFRLLGTLMSTPGTLVSRSELTQKVLGRALSPYDRALDTHVSNLRSKLGKNDDGKSPIRSVRGEGYMIVVCEP